MGNIQKHTLNINDELLKAHHESSGAVVLFSGDVRNMNKGKHVEYLEYEAYEIMADEQISKIVSEAIEKYQLQYGKCIHRVGKLQITDTAVVVLTSSIHREQAYQANMYIIDRVKQEAFIWKKEMYLNGEHQWGNNCDCATHSDPQFLVKALIK